MTPAELKARTKAMALRVMRMVDRLPTTMKGRVIADQILRSATSVGANYRAACRGRSSKEFVAKLGIVIEEADETQFWLELIGESGLLKPNLIEPLRREVDELIAIMVASRKTAIKELA